MSQISTAPPSTVSSTPSTLRTVLRWLVTFAGYPLGGVAAMVLTGPVDSLGAAIGGGIATGTVLGAVQAWGLRADRRFALGWVLATAVGLAVGLAIGSGVVDYATSLGDLALQGAISGTAVGATQAVALRNRLGWLAAAWPAYLALVWAVGWVVTTAIGVQVDEQFTVFGSAGAVTVTLLTAVLPLVLSKTSTTTEKSAS